MSKGRTIAATVQWAIHSARKAKTTVVGADSALLPHSGKCHTVNNDDSVVTNLSPSVPI